MDYFKTTQCPFYQVYMRMPLSRVLKIVLALMKKCIYCIQILSNTSFVTVRSCNKDMLTYSSSNIFLNIVIKLDQSISLLRELKTATSAQITIQCYNLDILETQRKQYWHWNLHWLLYGVFSYVSKVAQKFFQTRNWLFWLLCRSLYHKPLQNHSSIIFRKLN
jgi:hypothetical protein